MPFIISMNANLSQIMFCPNFWCVEIPCIKGHVLKWIWTSQMIYISFFILNSYLYIQKSLGAGLPGSDLVAKSCLTLETPQSLPGSSVLGISQARILEWVVTSSPGDLPNLEIEPCLLHSSQILYLTEPSGRHSLLSLISIDQVHLDCLLTFR